jgi:Holliday junction DNA helicase RuvA
MLSYIKGILQQATGTVAVIEAGGIGYEIVSTNAAIAGLPPIGRETKLFVHLNVREDGMSLYGFCSPEEKQMFYKLISVSGIGPKVAMSVLSGMPLSTLALCIITGDTKAIARIKGIGKKTAERIVLELKEKMTNEEADFAADALPEAASGPDKTSAEAIAALRSLGITLGEAQKAVASVRRTSSTIEELITNALRAMNG